MDKDNGPGLRDSWSTVLVAVTSERMLGKEASCHGGGWSSNPSDSQVSPPSPE